eukprot:scaffold131138_cov30-Tisochrysis_lutea.AAC.1
MAKWPTSDARQTHILSCASTDEHLMSRPGSPQPASLAMKPAKASIQRRPCLKGARAGVRVSVKSAQPLCARPFSLAFKRARSVAASV